MANDDKIMHEIDENGENAANDARATGAGKPTAEERQYRIEIVKGFVAQRKKKGVVKRWAKDEWGIAPRTFENYWSEAYALLLAEQDTNADDEFRLSCAYYDEFMSNDSNPPGDRLKARIAKDQLTGIQRPKKVAVTDSKGNDLPRSLSTIELRAIMLDAISKGQGEVAVNVETTSRGADTLALE